MQQKKNITHSHDLVTPGNELFVISFSCPFECNIGAQEGTCKGKETQLVPISYKLFRATYL